IKVSITKSTYDKMRQKRKEEKEPLHIKDCEKKEQNPWERFKHTGTEKMASENLNVFGDEVGISKNESSPLANVAFIPPLKGLGEIPLDTPSAKGRRSHTSSVGNTRSSSVSRDVFNSAEREVNEICDVTRKSVPRNSLESAEYIKVITSLLNAKDFRDRINGIKQLLSDTENNQDLVVGNIVKIFDAFKSRLHDSNSKVNLVALETMHKMIPLLRDNLSPIINMLIPAIVDNNLNSKNPGIYAAATNVVQALSQHVDNYLLLQPFCTKAQFLNGKAKQDMTEKLAEPGLGVPGLAKSHPLRSWRTPGKTTWTSPWLTNSSTDMSCDSLVNGDYERARVGYTDGAGYTKGKGGLHPDMEEGPPAIAPGSVLRACASGGAPEPAGSWDILGSPRGSGYLSRKH
ncbi:hypothetical protein MC885_004368, partial [Smutsia gigantea]